MFWSNLYSSRNLGAIHQGFTGQRARPAPQTAAGTEGAVFNTAFRNSRDTTRRAIFFFRNLP